MTSLNVSKLLLELGKGVAYVGEQYALKIQGDEFFIDLLFYNYILHCFVAIDIKTGKFVPEYAGKMNFYLSVLTKPIAVSEYKLLEEIPDELRDTLPSIEEIEARVLEKYDCE